MEVLSILRENGFSLTDLADHLPKIHKGLEFLKSKMHFIKEYEKTLNMKAGEKFIVSLIPIVTDHKTEILVCGFIIAKNDREETVIVREAFKLEGLSKLEELIATIPKS